jgi:hypothetical protein
VILWLLRNGELTLNKIEMVCVMVKKLFVKACPELRIKQNTKGNFRDAIYEPLIAAAIRAISSLQAFCPDNVQRTSYADQGLGNKEKCRK